MIHAKSFWTGLEQVKRADDISLYDEYHRNLYQGTKIQVQIHSRIMIDVVTRQNIVICGTNVSASEP